MISTLTSSGAPAPRLSDCRPRALPNTLSHALMLSSRLLAFPPFRLLAFSPFRLLAFSPFRSFADSPIPEEPPCHPRNPVGPPPCC